MGVGPRIAAPEIAARAERYDSGSLTWPWRHDDPRVDRLQADVMRLVGVAARGSRGDVFDAALALARAAAGRRASSRPARSRATVPYLDEPWYC